MSLLSDISLLLSIKCHKERESGRTEEMIKGCLIKTSLMLIDIIFIGNTLANNVAIDSMDIDSSIC